MKFKKTKKDDLMNPGQVYVEHKLEETDFSMKASLAGVEMSGTLIFCSDDDLQDFARGLSDAWKDHLLLKRAVAKSLYV